MSTPAALLHRGSGWRPRMAPAQREAWGERLVDSTEAVQQAVAGLENDIDEALHDGCSSTVCHRATSRVLATSACRAVTGCSRSRPYGRDLDRLTRLRGGLRF